MGAPGSGKSTYANSTALMYQIICADDVRKALGQDGLSMDPRLESIVHSTTNIMCRAHMERRLDIIIDYCNTMTWSIEKWIKMGREYDYKIFGVMFDTDLQTCLSRRKQFIEKNGKEPIIRMHNQFKELREQLKEDALRECLFDGFQILS